MNRVRSATGSGTPSGATEAYLGSGNVARTPTGRPEASRGRPLIVRRRRVSSPFRRVPRSRVRPPGSFPSSSGSSGWRPTPRTRMRVMRFVSCRARLATSHRLMSASTWAAPTDGVDPSGTIGTGRGRAARVSASSGGVRRPGARPPPRHAGRSFVRSRRSPPRSATRSGMRRGRGALSMSPMSSSVPLAPLLDARARPRVRHRHRGRDADKRCGSTPRLARHPPRAAAPRRTRSSAAPRTSYRERHEARREDAARSSRASPRTAARGPCAPGRNDTGRFLARSESLRTKPRAEALCRNKRSLGRDIVHDDTRRGARASFLVAALGGRRHGDSRLTTERRGRGEGRAGCRQGARPPASPPARSARVRPAVPSRSSHRAVQPRRSVPTRVPVHPLRPPGPRSFERAGRGKSAPRREVVSLGRGRVERGGGAAGAVRAGVVRSTPLGATTPAGSAVPSGGPVPIPTAPPDAHRPLPRRVVVDADPRPARPPRSDACPADASSVFRGAGNVSAPPASTRNPGGARRPGGRPPEIRGLFEYVDRYQPRDATSLRRETDSSPTTSPPSAGAASP